MRLFILALGVLMSVSVAAQIYKYVDENGRVVYTDRPPEGQEVEQPNLPNLIFQPATQAPLTKPDFGATNEAGEQEDVVVPHLSIVAPTADQTFPIGLSSVTLRVALTAPLPDGYQLQAVLDGAAYARPQTSTQWSLSGVGLGQHVVSVQLLDDEGQTAARSNSVRFFRLPN